VDDAAFAAWKDAPRGNRGADYSALKERISEGLLDLAETAVPGLKALVTYRELSTPLTVEHYTSHAKGRFYGLPAVPDRYRGSLLGPVSPVPGLFLSGSDAGCLGIVGALMGGVAAATRVLGGNGFFRIMAAVRGGRVAPAATEGAPEKSRAVLAAKRRLSPSAWELRWTLEEPLSFAPGQFARVRVAEHEWRDYSIAAADGPELTRQRLFRGKAWA
jgi:all-trans-retinol 13,14-reductase